MDLQAVRAGLATELEALPDVTIMGSIPDHFPATANTVIVVGPGSPYVTYEEASGGARIRRALVRYTLTIIPATSDVERAMDTIDDFLSAGTGRTWSIYDTLRTGQTLDGTSCMVNSMTASVVSLPDAGESHSPVGQIDLEVLVRTV